MTFEVDYTVLKNNKHISVHTAWIDAPTVTACKTIATELINEIPCSEPDICLHIGELEQLDIDQER